MTHSIRIILVALIHSLVIISHNGAQAEVVDTTTPPTVPAEITTTPPTTTTAAPAPTDLVIKSGTDSLSISWSGTANQVYVNNVTRNCASVTISSCNITGLTPGTVNNVSICAGQGACVHNSSVTKPQPVSNLSAGELDGWHVNVTWDNPTTGAWDSITVNCTKVDSSESTVKQSMTRDSTSAEILSLEPGHRYNCSAWTESYGIASSKVYTSVATRPQPVSDLIASEVEGGCVNITWQKPANGTWVSINISCIDEESQGATNQSVSSYNEQSSAIVTGLVSGHRYCCIVWTESNEIQSELLNLSIVMKPMPVTNLTVVELDNGSGLLTWINPTEGLWDAVAIVHCNASDCQVTNITASASITPPSNFKLSNLMPGSRYNITLLLYSYGVCSTDEVTNINLKPLAVTGLTVIESSIGTATLNWTNPTMGSWDTVSVQYCNSNSCFTNRTTRPAHSLTLNLVPGAKYNFTVTVLSNEVQSQAQQTELSFTPTPVSNLEESVVKNPTSVTITWSAGAGARDTSNPWSISVSPATNSPAVNINGESATISGLIADTKYTISVQSIGQGGNLSSKTSVNVTTDEDNPSNATSLSIYGATNDSLTVKWDKPSPANGVIMRYVITAVNGSGICHSAVVLKCSNCTGRATIDYDAKMSTSLCKFSENASDYVFSDTTYTATVRNLSPFTIYTISVFSINSKEPSVSTTTGKTSAAAPSGSPAEVAVSSVAFDNLTISWLAVSNSSGIVLGYLVYYKHATDDERSLNVTGALTAHLTGLQPFSDYTIQVAAYTSAQVGPRSERAVFRTGQYLPSAPRNPVVKPSGRSLNLTWEAPDPVNGIIIEYLLEIRSSSWNDSKLINGSKHSMTFDALDPNTNYVITIRARTEYNSSEAGPWGDSTEINSTTLQEPPEPPTSVMTKVVSSTELMLLWQPPRFTYGDVTNYTVHRNGTSEVEVVPSDARNYTFSGLNPYTVYELSVAASNLRGGKGQSIIVFNQTMQAAPVPLKTVNADLIQSLTAAAHVTTETVSVPLPENISLVFNLSNGPISKYQVLVIAMIGSWKSSSNIGGYGDMKSVTNPKTWAEAKVSEFGIPYAPMDKQKSPESWRTGSRSRRSSSNPNMITVGNENCDEAADSGYCNGPLDDGKKYCIYLRGFTEQGYADSECIATPATEKNNTQTIVIAVVVPVVVILVMILVIVLWRRRIGPFKKLDEERTPINQSPKSRPQNRPPSPPPQAIQLEFFIDHVNNMHKDQDFRFSQEYQRIKDMSAKHTQDTAVSGCNTSKNRWVDILPFDHSRVKLLPADEEEGSDYINANYMPGYNSKREFIATQGPLPGTIDHFWRMIWEQNVSTIVMLTQLIERGRRKCEQYWPESLEEPCAFGDIVVTKRNESVLPEYTIRIFDMQMGEITRSVKQFFVSFWPDFGCPAKTSSLLNLVRVVRSHIRVEHKGPLLCHCSAGVGRTGTYIAVDRLLQHIQDHDEIDVFSLVLEMREFRCRMVQTEDQYIYIHDCLKEALLQNMSRRFKPTQAQLLTRQMEEDEEPPAYENVERQGTRGTEMVEMGEIELDDQSNEIHNTEM